VVPSAVADNITRAARKVEPSAASTGSGHIYATKSSAGGVGIATVSRQLRHSGVAMTMNTYAQSKDADIHKAWG
jgi:integrase